MNGNASRWIRNGPSFLYRWLPYGTAVVLDRLKVLLLPLVALLLPLFRIAPPLYQWRVRSRVYRWYAAVRAIDVGPTASSFVRGTLTRSTTTGAGGEGWGGFVWAANEANWGYVGYISELVTGGTMPAPDSWCVTTTCGSARPSRWTGGRPGGLVSSGVSSPGFTIEHYVEPGGGATQEGFVSLRPFTLQLENGGQVQYVLQPHWQRPRAAFRVLSLRRVGSPRPPNLCVRSR
jgi:hypothetical protein